MASGNTGKGMLIILARFLGSGILAGITGALIFNGKGMLIILAGVFGVGIILGIVGALISK